MLTVAYLANEYPSAVEPYVSEEIEELQRRGVRVIPGTVRTPRIDVPEICILLPSPRVAFQALWLILSRFRRITPLLVRVVTPGPENWLQRAKALAHTFFGACYAASLSRRRVDHIHVHHGYFGSWIGMTAARLLNVGFSITLHGSDLLLHGSYLDLKLAECRFCFTISDYNRDYIRRQYPQIDAAKILVSRLGVNIPEKAPPHPLRLTAPFTMLAVGRLHAVKDHAFLVRACAKLRDEKMEFRCSIAGDGPERAMLEAMIREYGLGPYVTLLGHIAREELDSLYENADVVVLTSRSEGIPLVLMEAMARGKIVLAPAITGIPELVIHERTGFLYEPGSMPDFLGQMLLIHALTESERGSRPGIEGHAFMMDLQPIKEAAVARVRQQFERKRNLQSFCELFIERVSIPAGNIAHENFVLQQVQPSI